MAYEYFKSGSLIALQSNTDYWNTSKQILIDDQFTNSPNIKAIEVESPFSSGSFVQKIVRCVPAINSETGEKLGSDFKTLLFKTPDEGGTIGTKYKFDENYWLVVNRDGDGYSATVRRCNNVLRWMFPSGSPMSEHCIIDYKIAAPKDISIRTDIPLPDGTIRIYSQLNENTRQIKENQRFLFGSPPDSWSCWSVYGAGIRAFLNEQTESNTSASLVEFILGRDMVNYDLDNIELGIADYYKIPVLSSLTENSIRILPTSGSVLEGETQIYTVHLVSGSVQLSDAFTFSVSGSTTVQPDRYAFSVLNGNQFSVKNLKQDLDNSLFIDCITSGSLRTKELWMRGAW